MSMTARIVRIGDTSAQVHSNFRRHPGHDLERPPWRRRHGFASCGCVAEAALECLDNFFSLSAWLKVGEDGIIPYRTSG
jgi:hypothetical protein